MKLGTLTPSFRLGSNTPSRIYLGTNQVWSSYDVEDYFARIVAAGSSISEANKTAVRAFVSGCQSDGIFDAIKASCILAGADTLAGALVPLVGSAPTNVNFVAGDYSRTTGMKGNGSSKYLNSSTPLNSLAQNNNHLSIYTTANPTANGCYIGASDSNSTGSAFVQIFAVIAGNMGFRNMSGTGDSSDPLAFAGGFVGNRRNNSTNYSVRVGGNSATKTVASNSGANATNFSVFARNINGAIGNYTDARIAFYSIGESLDLAQLNARLATLMSSLT